MKYAYPSPVIKKVYIKKDVADHTRGEVLVAHWTPNGYHLYSPARRTIHRFAIPAPCVPFVENDYCALFNDGVIRNDERPFYIHPVFIHGYTHHGPWLCLDDLWLTPNGNDEACNKLRRVLSLCRKPAEWFSRPIVFYEWFGKVWPDGLFLDYLNYLSKKGQIPD